MRNFVRRTRVLAAAPPPAIFPSHLVFLDTETTGLKGPRNDIIEVAAVLTDIHGREVDTFQTYVEPRSLGPEHSEALSICKITPKMLIGAPSRPDVVKRMFAKFNEWTKISAAANPSDAPTKLPVLAYNTSFDKYFMNRLLLPQLLNLDSVEAAEKAPIAERTAALANAPFEWGGCVMERAAAVFWRDATTTDATGDRARELAEGLRPGGFLKLGIAFEYFAPGAPQQVAHRALNDVRMTVEVARGVGAWYLQNGHTWESGGALPKPKAAAQSPYANEKWVKMPISFVGGGSASSSSTAKAGAKTTKATGGAAGKVKESDEALAKKKKFFMRKALRAKGIYVAW